LALASAAARWELLTLLVDALHYAGLYLGSPAALAAENLFLRKQLALYRERNVKPRHAIPAIRIALVWLGHWFDWRQAMAVGQPATFVRWHRQGFRLFCGRYQHFSSQRWLTFVRTHTTAMAACDFCIVVTATFRLLDVFVVMEHATRQVLHGNVATHPTAQWTLQQLRDAIAADHGYHFLVHDRKASFS
jgi:hypothetical protein